MGPRRRHRPSFSPPRPTNGGRGRRGFRARDRPTAAWGRGWEPPGGYGPPQPYPALAPPAHAPWGPGCPPSSYAAPPAQYPPLMGPPGFPAAAYPSPADGLPGHFQPSPGAAPAAGQVPAGLMCSLEKWQTGQAHGADHPSGAVGTRLVPSCPPGDVGRGWERFVWERCWGANGVLIGSPKIR